MPEPFSWQKLFAGFGDAVGWVKAAAIAVRILAIASIVGIPMLTYHSGLVKGRLEGIATGLKQCPPPVQITGNGAVINQNAPVKRSFEVCVWPLHVGW